MRTAIVMTYFERPEQLSKTLKSFEQYQNTHIVIVDDGSIEKPAFGTKNCTIVTVTDKAWVNTCVPYNIGFEAALEQKPDIIIIQNAECYHAGDIVGHAAKHLTDANYISYGCYSLAKGSTLPPLIRNPQGATFDGEAAWYNHTVFRPVGYHFCSAITADNLKKLNGFDERLAYGIAYEDNMFLHQVRCLGLKVKITEDPFVYHQYHTIAPRDPFLIKKNADLFSLLSQSKEYRAKHIITADL